MCLKRINILSTVSWQDFDERVTWKLFDVKGWLSKKTLRSRKKCGLCALLLKSGRAHRECSKAREKRIQVHPAKLGEVEKRVRSAALLRLVTLPRPCVSSRIVLRKQKTGSLCPAFKSIQSSVSSAPHALFPRPSPAYIFFFLLTLRLGSLTRSSLLSRSLSLYHLSFEQG